MTAERILVERALRGDHDAFGLLIRKYQYPLYSLALLRVRNSADAEEIVQETFLAAYRNLGQLKDHERFGAWLKTIARRQGAMWLRTADRRRGRESKMDETRSAQEISFDDGGGPFDIGGMIRELPPGMRAAASLCLEEDLAPAAAAAVLGVQPATLRKRLHKARARLQRLIVDKAEKTLQMELLPADFARRCICRCQKSQSAQKGGEERMSDTRNCGCGCLEKDSREPVIQDVRTIAAPRKKKSSEKKEK